MKFSAALLVVCSATLGVRAEPTVKLTADSPYPSHEVACDTPQCKSAARDILDRLSPKYKKMNACSNFDEMVCGGWRDKHDLRQNQFQMSTTTLMEEQVKASLRDIIEKQPYKNTWSEADINFDKLKASYEACMDTKTLAGLGLGPLRMLLEEVDRSQSINDYLKVLMNNGVATLLNLESHIDAHNPNSHILGVSAPSSLGLPSKRYYDNEDILGEYGDVIAHILGTLYPDVPEYVSRKIVDLEIKLAAFMPDDDHSKKGPFEKNTMSLSDAAQLAPEIDLEGLVTFFKPDSATVEYVAMHHSRYIQALSEILKNEPHEVLEAYFRWQTIISYADYVQDSVFDGFYRLQSRILELELVEPAPSGQWLTWQTIISFAGYVQGSVSKGFYRLLGRIFGLEFVEPDPSRRWLTCINHLEKGLGWSLGNMLLYSSFTPRDERLGAKIVDDVKSQFQSKLQESAWMDSGAKAMAMAKIGNMVHDIGYSFDGTPDAQCDDEVGTYYASVYVKADTYLENEKYMRRTNVLKNWESLAKPGEDSEWREKMTTPLGSYYPDINRLVLTPSLLQRPIFGAEIPAYISYGSVGSITAREMSRSFGLLGRHYDHQNHFESWWSEQTLQGFNDKAQCFINEYSKLTVPNDAGEDFHINGTSTLEENISDFYGLSMAYKAWAKYSKGTTANPLLPGLDFFTRDQLFFVSFGSLWCSKSTSEATLNEAMAGKYTPLSLRTNAIMANSREFQEAFGCPVKESTCEI
ncbi:Neprilysin-11 [Ceratocystis fimbriata CBS 114723]|uniref:Neprilysin-11 n=1 Tax=Ceratocystis fimbriata CBS 114723 TaxID=1035309 RepID=A0A2C5WX89_9PEZI|nr:Neprilysin-11 [Ceratocystis fimbriata CBS 114723]